MRLTYNQRNFSRAISTKWCRTDCIQYDLSHWSYMVDYQHKRNHFPSMKALKLNLHKQRCVRQTTTSTFITLQMVLFRKIWNVGMIKIPPRIRCWFFRMFIHNVVFIVISCLFHLSALLICL